MGIDQPFVFYDKVGNFHDKPYSPVRREFLPIHTLNQGLYIFLSICFDIKINFGQNLNVTHEKNS
ncbi:MAG: hypothetical protein CMH46_13740 [Muricauda sp.]|nr:hypothetical protein [Allomuricauda sp.]